LGAQVRGGWFSSRRLLFGDSMIRVTPRIAIDENELHFEFIRAGGPGGQNVNKVSSAVRLRFDVRGSASLPLDVRVRLIRLAGKRVGDDGVLMIHARSGRTQESNRRDAIERLVELIAKASERPTPRRPTKPTIASRERRVEAKKRRGASKEGRSKKPDAE
jgi:ribosome-associated protein